MSDEVRKERRKKKKAQAEREGDGEDDAPQEDEAKERDESKSSSKRKKKKKEVPAIVADDDNAAAEEPGEDAADEEGKKDKKKKRKYSLGKKGGSLIMRRATIAAKAAKEPGTPKSASADDMARKIRSNSLDVPASGQSAQSVKFAKSEPSSPVPERHNEEDLTGARQPSEKSEKMSRWNSLRQLRDGILKADKDKKSRTMNASEIFKGGHDDDESSSSGGVVLKENPLVALNKKQKELQKKKENQVLSESASLPERERMRNKVVNELIKTERDYIKDLEIIIKLFIEPLEEEGILTKEELKDIFSNIRLLININRELLDDIWKQAKDTNGEFLSKCFLTLADYLKMYSQYCGNQKISRETVHATQARNSRFKAFLEKKATDPELNNLTLKDYLIKPIQRLCKYPLLLRELIRYTDDGHRDYQGLKEALEKIENVVTSVNAQQKTEEEVEEVAEILNKLKGAEQFGVQLMVPGRRFVREGVIRMTMKDQTAQSIAHYFLFSDLLILCEAPFSVGAMSAAAALTVPENGGGSTLKGRRKSDRKSSKMRVLAMLPFAMCLLAEASSDGSNAIELIYAKEVYTFVPATREEKKWWLEDALKNVERTDTGANSDED